MPSTEEEKLVNQAVDGNADALKILLLGVDPFLRHRLGRCIPPELGRLIDAGDIVQEAYTDVFRSIGAFRPRGRDSFFRWVTTIALNRLRNTLRNHRAAKRRGFFGAETRGELRIEDSTVAVYNLLASPTKTPSRIMARREAIEAVQTGMGELPPRHREAIQRVYLEGESVASAAQGMACTDRAVHGLCRRGLKLLEKQLRDNLGSFSSVG